MTYIIYKTTNQINGKYYVGQHNTSANDGYLGSGIVLKQAIEKYGKENFLRETIEFCTSANVNEREIYWIGSLDATNPKVGYNLHEGGIGGKVWKGEHPSKRRKGKDSHWFGRKHSLETKLKISEKATGRKHSNETRKKISESHIGMFRGPMSEEQKKKLSEDRKGNNHWNFGKKFSKETRKKMSESQSKEKHSQNKYVFTLSNGENYWELPKNMRANINGKFRIKNTNVISYKGIQIERRVK